MSLSCITCIELAFGSLLMYSTSSWLKVRFFGTPEILLRCWISYILANVFPNICFFFYILFCVSDILFESGGGISPSTVGFAGSSYYNCGISPSDFISFFIECLDFDLTLKGIGSAVLRSSDLCLFFGCCGFNLEGDIYLMTVILSGCLFAWAYRSGLIPFIDLGL